MCRTFNSIIFTYSRVPNDLGVCNNPAGEGRGGGVGGVVNNRGGWGGRGGKNDAKTFLIPI